MHLSYRILTHQKPRVSAKPEGNLIIDTAILDTVAEKGLETSLWSETLRITKGSLVLSRRENCARQIFCTEENKGPVLILYTERGSASGRKD